MWNRNNEPIMGCEAAYEEANIVVYGAPFDSTTSNRPGARFGPRAIRADSYALETYSPYQDRDLADCRIFDAGDLTLCIGDAGLALDEIERAADTFFADGKLPILLGGEHLVTLGAIHVAVKKYPDLHIVHFDAHTDLREDYLGAGLSHATVLRRCHELTGDGRIYQFGIRSGEKTEFVWAGEHTYLQKFGFFGLEEAVKALAGKPVYLTIDMDVMDPSVFPGTGTPEPGGASFLETLRAMNHVLAHANVVGADLVELAPMLDASGASTAVACKLLREMLLQLSAKF